MKWGPVISSGLIVLGLTLALSAAARTQDVKQNTKQDISKQDVNKDDSTPSAAASRHAEDEAARLEGEKRYRANCSRCHAAPPKFPPRMMSTIIRHMRVRANITDEDRRLILRYMTQ